MPIATDGKEETVGKAAEMKNREIREKMISKYGSGVRMISRLILMRRTSRSLILHTPLSLVCEFVN